MFPHQLGLFALSLHLLPPRFHQVRHLNRLSLLMMRFKRLLRHD